MKKVGLILVFCILPGLFFTIQNIKETKYLTKTEMRQLWAGVTCYERSCTNREPCGITNGILQCLGRDFNAPCAPACESGFKINKRCDGARLPPNRWCEQNSFSCDKGKDGWCIGRYQQNHNYLLYCVADPFSQNNYPTCGPVTDCVDKP